jgi:hypothetical protein
MAKRLSFAELAFGLSSFPAENCTVGNRRLPRTLRVLAMTEKDMLEFEVKAKGFDRALQSLRSFETVAANENRKAMGQAVALVVQTAGKKVPTNLGHLRASITGKVVGAAAGTVVGVVGAYEPYANVVEEGADPHWPNATSLALWVLRVLRVPRKDVESVTFLIGRMISRRGLRARPYLQPAFEENQGKIRGLFEKALARIVRRLGG